MDTDELVRLTGGLLAIGLVVTVVGKVADTLNLKDNRKGGITRIKW